MKNIFTLWIPVLLFHFLFWDVELGLNLLLFTWVLTGSIYMRKQFAFERKQVLALLVAWNISAIFFIIHDSLLGVFVYALFFFVLIGALQQQHIRSWFLILAESFRGLVAGWAINLRHSLKKTSANKQWVLSLKNVGLLIIPILILIPFYFVYTAANADFAQLSDQFWAALNAFFHIDIDGDKLAHFFLGAIIVSAVIGQRLGLAALLKLDEKLQFDLLENQHTSPHPNKTISLKSEYQMALLSFIALNALLLLVNAIDLFKVWFSFEEKTAAELSQYVHQGTYLLILSIIMAMIVVLGFLRGDLNFYAKGTRPHQLLLKLVFLWLAQNAFLAVSVAIRNGHYIAHYGLAHGRIVVVVFLLLVLFGLYSMYQKVKGPKTIFYLIQKNGWAFLTIMLLVSTVHWDAFITRYNLKHHPSDINYVNYSLHNNLIPLIDDLQGKHGAQPSIELKDISSKGESHARRWENSDWRSWTWGNYRQYQAWIEVRNSSK